jgi:hypothetical protein
MEFSYKNPRHAVCAAGVVIHRGNEALASCLPSLVIIMMVAAVVIGGPRTQALDHGDERELFDLVQCQFQSTLLGKVSDTSTGGVFNPNRTWLDSTL